MKYWAIITPEQWKRSILGTSTGIDLSNADQNNTVEEAIEDATSVIEEYLRKPVIVRRKTINLATTGAPITEQTRGRIRFGMERSYEQSDWTWEHSADDGDGKYVHYPTLRPIVQVVTSDVTIGPESLRFEADDERPEIDYFGGYKRKGQTLSDLQNDLPELTVEPDDVPATIRRVCTNLTTYELQRNEHGLIAMQSRSVNTGDVSSDVTRFDANFYERELKRLDPLV